MKPDSDTLWRIKYGIFKSNPGLLPREAAYTAPFLEREEIKRIELREESLRRFLEEFKEKKRKI